MSTPVLQVSQLCTFLEIGGAPVCVVDHLSFDLFKGKTLALVGESGCGKTMAAMSILRILPTPPALYSTGKVIYANRNLLDLKEKEMQRIRGASIAMIFQNPSSALNPVYTIKDQLLEVVEWHLHLYGDEAESRIIQVLEEVGIPAARDRLNDYPHQLSGGMKQRIMIAMALICEPDILIADEPTTALDVTIQAQVLELMRDLQARKGMALLLITHDLGVVAEMADEVIVMYAAQAAERAPVQSLFHYPSHPYTKGLFKSRPQNEVKNQRLQAVKGSVPPPNRFPTGCRFHPRCPYIMPKCQVTNVEEIQISSSHTARCLLHDGTQESQTKLIEFENE